jgi:hypothetical protein
LGGPRKNFATKRRHKGDLKMSGVKKCNRCETYIPSDATCLCDAKYMGIINIPGGTASGGGAPSFDGAGYHPLSGGAGILPPPASQLTLPTDSAERKNYPLLRGVLRYFPAALAGVARISKLGNDKHNPGEDLHHARGKSTDHGDCIIRHLMDAQDLLAMDERSALTPKGVEELLTEVSSLAWRALALSQELHEQYGKAPLAPGAKKQD